MTTRILVAEDEPLMLERLLGMLEAYWPEAEVAKVAQNGNDAWDGFLEHEPEVAFLDVRMPGLSGIDVAERIGRRAHVVFVTAFDQYAVSAFEAGATDYLVKPVEAQRFQVAIARLKERLGTAPTDVSALLAQLRSAVSGRPPERLKWMKAMVGRQIRLIDIDKVLFVQSDTKYTRVVLPEFEALVRTPIKDLLGSLDPSMFWQIHRGTVVNAGAIVAAERVDAERLQVILKGSSERLTVSRTFNHLFKE